MFADSDEDAEKHLYVGQVFMDRAAFKTHMSLCLFTGNILIFLPVSFSRYDNNWIHIV